MALQTSGQISLNDIHVEAGGTSGTACNINEADIRGLISASSGAAMDFADWYGASSSQDFTTVKSGHTFHTYTGGRGSTQYGFAIGFNCPAAATDSSGTTPPSGSLSYTGNIVVNGTTLGTIQKMAHRHTLIGRTSIEFEIQGTNTNSGFTYINFNNSGTNGVNATFNRTSFGYTYANGKRTYVYAGITSFTSADSPANTYVWGGSGSATSSFILGPTTGNSNGTGTESNFSATVTFS